jgi:hypothetical protein
VVVGVIFNPRCPMLIYHSMIVGIICGVIDAVVVVVVVVVRLIKSMKVK